MEITPPFISAIASCVSTTCFIASIGVAIWQIRRARQNQAEATARSIFAEYLKLAMQNPILAYPDGYADKFDYQQRKLMNSIEDFEKYEWFFTLMLFSMKEILEVLSHSDYWKKLADRQIRYHLDYIRFRLQKENRDKTIYKDDFLSLVGPQIRELIAAAVPNSEKSNVLTTTIENEQNSSSQRMFGRDRNRKS